MDIGTIVTARPWHEGSEQAPRRGVIIGTWGCDREYRIVWFYTLRAPAIGDTIQPILTTKITIVGSFRAASDRRLREWERAAYAAHLYGDPLQKFGMKVAAERGRRRQNQPPI